MYGTPGDARDRPGDARPRRPRGAEFARRITGTDDTEEIQRLTIAFHAAIVDAAASPRIKVVLAGDVGTPPGQLLRPCTRQAIEIERKGLVDIATAVADGDADKASDGYERMMGRQGELVVQLFTDRGLFGEVTT